MTQSWLPVGANIPCSSRHLPVRTFFLMNFALLEDLLVVSIAFGTHLWKLYKDLHCLFGFEYQQ